jgi:2-dehydro-3-deoxyphosphooctonate aldolase (KDO 8-P synthase)
MAEALMEATARVGIPLIFKASFDKANRSSAESFRGIGTERGLAVLRRVRSLGVPVLTDVHESSQTQVAAACVDCLQIPAFLARQTDLLLAAGRTGIPVNVKKAQFMSPFEMRNACDKVLSTGNSGVLVTERGTTFGYNNLVVDFRSLEIMREMGHPIVFDATHSVQLPGAEVHGSGGQAQYIPALARAAVAVGVDALFVEVHDDPARALSDAANALALSALHDFLCQVLEIDAASRRARSYDSSR